MGSNRQKRKLLAEKRKLKRDRRLRISLQTGNVLSADWTLLHSRSCMPHFPDYYSDKRFKCCDCGSREVWTAKQQKWWYEEAGGQIESTAIRCRPCRKIEAARKALARKVHFEGLAKKGKEPDKPVRSDWLPSPPE